MPPRASYRFNSYRHLQSAWWLLISSFPSNAPLILRPSHTLHVLVIIPFCMQWNFNVQRSTKLIGFHDVCSDLFVVVVGTICSPRVSQLLLRQKLISIISLQIYVRTLYNQIKFRYLYTYKLLLIRTSCHRTICAITQVSFQHICVKFVGIQIFPLRSPQNLSHFFNNKNCKNKKPAFL